MKAWKQVTVAVAIAASTSVCGGSTTAPPAPLPLPTVTMSMTPGETGVITGVTEARFSATASGLGPGIREFTWDFGDGATARGPEASHVFATQGTFTVTVTFRDSGRTVTERKTVEARLIDGFWRSETFDWWFELHQSGRTITGRVLGQRDVRYSGTVPLEGSIELPNRVRFTVPNFPPLGFTGPPSPALDRIVGQIEFQVPRADTLVRMAQPQLDGRGMP